MAFTLLSRTASSHFLNMCLLLAYYAWRGNPPLLKAAHKLAAPSRKRKEQGAAMGVPQRARHGLGGAGRGRHTGRRNLHERCDDVLRPYASLYASTAELDVSTGFCDLLAEMQAWCAWNSYLLQGDGAKPNEAQGAGQFMNRRE